MQPEKKQLELLLMHYFRECNTNFPKGKVVPSESPDFVLKLKTRNKIGIELTRLNPVNARLPDLTRIAQLKLRMHFIETVQTLFQMSSSLKLFVKFLFAENKPLEDRRIISVSARVTNAIRKAVLHKRPSEFFYRILDNQALPEGLESILIVHHPAMETPVWEPSNNLGISDDVVADIRFAILKKDEKLRLYHRQSLNYYWLVIVTDRLRGNKNYNLHDKVMNLVFESNFQNVFLFDLIQSKVLQLV